LFIVALAAGEIELTFTKEEIVFSSLVIVPRRTIDIHGYRLSPRETGDISCQPQKIVAFIFQWVQGPDNASRQSIYACFDDSSVSLFDRQWPDNVPHAFESGRLSVSCGRTSRQDRHIRTLMEQGISLIDPQVSRIGESSS
jgi:hypothetical protein